MSRGSRGVPRCLLGRPGAATAAVAVLAAGTAGCGSTPPPSLIQLRVQATRICATASRQIGRIATPPSEAGGEAFLERGVAVLAPELRRLRRLTAPSEADDVYRAALGALSEQVDALRQATRALERQEDPVVAFKALQVPTCMSR